MRILSILCPRAFLMRPRPPLLCAGIIGYRALRLSGIQPGGRLGLFGFGASAHIAIQVAHYWGCEVLVFTRSPGHRELARQLGAAWVGQAQDTPPAKLDSAIIFAPAGHLVPQALKHLDRGGTLALAGIYMTPIPKLDYDQDLYFEKTVRSVTASTRQDGLELLDLAARIPLLPKVQLFPLAEANRALQLLKAGEIDGAGVLTVNP
jgi:propanol-preferring alcohol dehydrogenase